MRKVVVIILFFCIFFFLFTDPIVAQCAMCKQAAESSLERNPNSIARGLNSGILYLMAVPYLMIAFIFRKQIASLYRRWRGKEPVSE
jgi:hypothetical protein